MPVHRRRIRDRSDSSQLPRGETEPGSRNHESRASSSGRGKPLPLPAWTEFQSHITKRVLHKKTGPPLERWAGEVGVELHWLPRLERELQPARTCKGPLERELQSQLDEARIVHGAIHRAETECVCIADRRTELRVVE